VSNAAASASGWRRSGDANHVRSRTRSCRQTPKPSAPRAQWWIPAKCSRNAIVDDGRDYALYLAWFGPGLIKVGLTATERGTDRLAEQGALAFTWLGRGRLPAVRAGEQRISASGLAAERHRRQAKLAAWWRLPDRPQRQHEVRTAYQRIIGTVPWPPGLGRVPWIMGRGRGARS
jgi:Protein of unknown function (DUF2797)